MKKIKSAFFTLLLFAIPFNVAAKVWINEFMQSNIDGVRDDLNQFPDSWVELYNDSDAPVNIQNWYISDSPTYTEGWKIPKSVSIPAKGYQLIYCDKEATGIHTSFRLESGSGGAIYLFNTSGVLVDGVVNIPKQPAPNIARGRTQDAGDTWGYFITASPGKKNEGGTSNTLLPSPVFNLEGGIYEGAVMINFSLPSNTPAGISNSDIHYTTNGSEPTEASPRYHNTITITTTTTVKAKIIAPGYLDNRSVTHSYIIANRPLSLPVVSISLDAEYMWDSYFGIYVTGPSGITACNDKRANWNNDWRRPINIEYFTSVDEPGAINQLAEMRIAGGCSRGEPLKSLIVYANKRFGKKRFDYQLFNEKPGQEIKSFMLRNSGNDFWWTHFRDAAMQLFMGGKVDIDYQAYQPAILFINGEYFGIENIRERSEDDFIFANYDGLEDIDMIERWNTLKEGDKVDYDYMMNLLKGGGNYQAVMDMIDIDEYINYMILQVYVANYDFPGNNIVMWKPKTEGGKWRFILKDTDFGLSLWSSKESSYNSMVYNTKPSDNMSSSEIESRRLFNAMLTLDSFREKFYSRFAIYMGDLLHYKSTSHIIDSIREMLAPEMSYHLNRWVAYKWSKSINSWNRDVDYMKDWCLERNPHMYEILNEFFKLKGMTLMSLDVSDEIETVPVVAINDVTLQQPAFDGKYFQGETIRLHCSESGGVAVGWRIEAMINDFGDIDSKEFLSTDAEYTIPESCIDLKITLIKNPNAPPPDPIKVKNTESDQLRLSIVENNLSISGLEGNSVISIFDAGSRLVAKINTDSRSAFVNLKEKGVYVVQISDEKRKVSRKIVY